MPLSTEQKEYLQHLCDTLSDDSLLKLKQGNIQGIKNFNTKLIDPNLIAEHKEMKEIIKQEFRRRNTKKTAR